ncbi:MAG: isopenicillin N synthase family oxygenase, partial [Moorea sp. SIO2I5]|nr:isopenicillin N synthase family oxygenase [Moorena sp. SIO2I5]
SPMFSELTDNKANWYELVEFGVDIPSSDLHLRGEKSMHGLNLWPQKLPDYKNAIKNYVFYLEKLGAAILKGVSLSLEMPENFFKKQFTKDIEWGFRTVFYPKQRSTQSIQNLRQHKNNEKISEIEINSNYSCGEHTDYGFITLLLADKEGLQVKSRSGQWFSAAPLEGAFICLIGDMLQYWTNNLYVATKHRVLTQEERMSMAFFYQPSDDTIIQPFGINNGSLNKVGTPIKYGEYSCAIRWLETLFY